MRIIDRLRKRHPELYWWYSHGYWVNSAGWDVCRVFSMDDAVDEVSDRFRRSDTHEVFTIFSNTTRVLLTNCNKSVV